MNNLAQWVSLTHWAPLSLGFTSIGSTVTFFNAFDWFFDVVVPFEVFDAVGSFFTACQFEETLVLNLIIKRTFISNLYVNIRIFHNPNKLWQSCDEIVM
jgi:hypothetical protein